MSRRETMFFNKAYGCLLAGIIGDAMGAPAEGKTYGYIRERYGEIKEFSGTGTGDSVMKMMLCRAIIRNDGYVTADEFAEILLENRDKHVLFRIPEKNALHKIEAKISLPVYAGLGNMPGSSSAKAVSPLGIVNACNPYLAAMEAFDIAGLMHAGEATFCRDGACAVAAAVAEAMKPDATVDSVLEASTAYLHKISSAEMANCIRDVLDMARSAGEYDSFRERFYGRFSKSSAISDARETVPCAMALFYLAHGDPVKTIIYAANFGRDADTIATMAGSVAGAYAGAAGLKEEWIERVTANNPGQSELAEKLVETAMKKTAGLKQDIAYQEQLLKTPVRGVARNTCRYV